MSRAHLLVPTAIALGSAAAPLGRALGQPASLTDTAVTVVRVNQLGYRPDGVKVAVACSLGPRELATFTVEDTAGRRVFGPSSARRAAPFGPCAATHRLDFTRVTTPGRYRIVVGTDTSPTIRITPRAYAGAADTLLFYMRQQRSGYNPFLRDSAHLKDGIVVGDPKRVGKFVPVTGGWADASDYLQYVTTSANATAVMLMAYRDHPAAFADHFQANGLPGPNSTPDVLDEARHGLDWLMKMFPAPDELYNQLGDDRDHSFLDLPTTDSSDYGWGKGGPRPVYPCTGRPQGLLTYKNRSTGLASTAGKYASAFALGAQIYQERDPKLAARLKQRAEQAYEIGRAHPGVCQTAPARAPYFYEEDNWADDMELAAAELYALTGRPEYQRQALAYAAQEPVTPWMGADTARHYQWYPWHNNGHYAVWRRAAPNERRLMAAYYRRGLEAVVRRADNGFRIGVPFIWCSNNLVASFATQAYLYRRTTGDTRFAEYEAAALDWLFGTNPWGISMVIGLPQGGRYARDPHSVVAKQLGAQLTGGLVDGPVYATIFQSQMYARLHDPDEFARFNTGRLVYHDDFGDYVTNEPIMDGTANLTYLLAAMAAERPAK